MNKIELKHMLDRSYCSMNHTISLRDSRSNVHIVVLNGCVKMNMDGTFHARVGFAHKGFEPKTMLNSEIMRGNLCSMEEAREWISSEFGILDKLYRNLISDNGIRLSVNKADGALLIG